MTDQPSRRGEVCTKGFVPEQHGGVVTLLFTDVVGSTALKQQLGDRAGVALVQEHHALVRKLLEQFSGAQEVSTAGDSFLLVFLKPSDAVRFALRLQFRLNEFNQARAVSVQDRMGLHLGEIVIEEREGRRDVHGMQVDTCARVMSLAQGGQILMTRPVFDNARQSLKGEESEGVSVPSWLNHGRFELKGVEEPVEICEVRPTGAANLAPPTTSEKARRVGAVEGEAVLGWRPAVGQGVPNTKWVLEEKLGEGGFGEVWKARHAKLAEERVFKFCFRADRVRALKREVTLFRLMKERIGDHAHIVKLHDFFFEEPPYYLEEEYVAGKDLRTWCEAQGGADKVPLTVRLEIVAQAADALQAAHDAGVIHRDVKPGNFLVSNPNSAASLLSVKLTDFGIGQVTSEEQLAGVTRAGFTQTILADSSGSRTGTQLYMAPELLAGKPASTRSDIYSLGVVLYQLAVGDFTRPVTADWAESINDPLLIDDLRHCFAGKPEERFAAAGELAKRLRSSEQRRQELHARERMEKQAALRRKIVLVLAGVTTMLLLLAVALGYGLRQAKVAKSKETQLRRRAQAHAYAADMRLAQEALAQDNLRRAKELLDRHRPQDDETGRRRWEWRYLWQQCQGDPSITLGKKRSGALLAVSPDGKWVAIQDKDRAVAIWDLRAEKKTARLLEGSWLVRVAFSPKSPLLAYSCTLDEGSTNQQHYVRLWDLTMGKAIRELPLEGRCAGLAFSGDGRTLVTCSATLEVGGESEIALWQVPEGLKQARHPIPPAARESWWQPFAVADDLSVVAYSYGAYAGASDSTIGLMDLATGTERWTVECTDLGFSALAFSPDGKTLAAASGKAESRIRLLSVASGQEIGQLESPGAYPRALVFWPDGRTLASGDDNQTIRLWDVETHQLLGTLRSHSTVAHPLVLLPDQTTLVSGAYDGLARLWDTTTLRGDRTPYRALTNVSLQWCFTPDSAAVITVDREGNIARWQGTNFESMQRGLRLGASKTDIRLSDDGSLVATGSTNGTVEVWDVKEGKRLHQLHVSTGRVRVLEFLAQPKGLVTIHLDDRPANVHRANRFTEWSELALPYPAEASVHEWDLTSGREIRTWKSRWPADTFGVAQSPNDRWLLAVGLGGTIWLGDRLTGRETVRELPIDQASDATFSRDGTRFANTSWAWMTKIWDTATLRELATIPAWSVSVAFSPDGKRLAVGGVGKSAITLWDVESQQEVLVLEGEGSNFWRTEFSPDGNVLGSLNMNRKGVLHLWRAPSWAEIKAAEMDQASP